MADKVQLIKEEIERMYKRAKLVDCFSSSVVETTLERLSDFIDSLPEEPANEDLEKEVIKFLQNGSEFRLNDSNYVVDKNGWIIDGETAKDFARHFAEWQKKKDQETIELAEDHAMLAGMMKEREEMMKDAVETEVRGYMTGVGVYVETDIPIGIDVNEGDKVKIIIVKED